MLLVNHRFFLGGGGIRGAKPLFLWIECKFAIFAVFVKTPFFLAGDKTTDFRKHGIYDPEFRRSRSARLGYNGADRRARKIRKILDVFEVFLGVKQKTPRKRRTGFRKGSFSRYSIEIWERPKSGMPIPVVLNARLPLRPYEEKEDLLLRNMYCLNISLEHFTPTLIVPHQFSISLEIVQSLGPLRRLKLRKSIWLKRLFFLERFLGQWKSTDLLSWFHFRTASPSEVFFHCDRPLFMNQPAAAMNEV